MASVSTLKIKHPVLLNAFGFQDETGSLCKGTEAHAVETDQSLWDRAWSGTSWKKTMLLWLFKAHTPSSEMLLHFPLTGIKRNPDMGQEWEVACVCNKGCWL